MGKSRRRKRRWWDDYDWNNWEPNGPYHEGCAIHDGKCTEGGDLHRYLAPNGRVALELCDNHVTMLDPELAGFEVTHEPYPATEPLPFAVGDEV